MVRKERGIRRSIREATGSSECQTIGKEWRRLLAPGPDRTPSGNYWLDNEICCQVRAIFSVCSQRVDAGQRQQDCEDRPFAIFAPHFYFPTVGFHDRFHNAQAQTIAPYATFAAASGADAVKAI